MTCLRYQVYLYVSGTIAYFKPKLRVVTETALCGCTASTMGNVLYMKPPHTPYYRQHYPTLYKHHYLHHLEENSSMVKMPSPMLKSKGKTVWLRNHHMQENCP